MSMIVQYTRRCSLAHCHSTPLDQSPGPAEGKALNLLGRLGIRWEELVN